MKVVTVESLGALTGEQKRFVTTVRILDSNADLTGTQLKRVVPEMFPPAVQFGKEICALSAVRIELRIVLDSLGANLHQYSSHRVVNIIAYGLNDETEAAAEIS